MNLIGSTFGDLMVVDKYSDGKRSYVKCVCSCGKIVHKRADTIVRSKRQDCRSHKQLNLAIKAMRDNPEIKNWDNWTLCAYDHSYMVSKNGEIIKTWLSGRMNKLNPAKNDFGYPHVTLKINGKPKTILMHRLIMDSFFGIPDGMQINHIDGNPGNNNIDNLEICTASQNSQHAVDTGLKEIRYGERSNNHKLTWDQVCEIREKYIPRKYTFKMLAEEYDCYPSHIKLIVDKEIWKRKQ